MWRGQSMTATIGVSNPMVPHWGWRHGGYWEATTSRATTSCHAVWVKSWKSAVHCRVVCAVTCTASTVSEGVCSGLDKPLARESQYIRELLYTVGTFSSQWRPRFLKARWDLCVVKNMWNGSFSTTWTCSHSKIRQISKRNYLSLYKLRSCIQNLCSIQSIKSSALKFNWKLRCTVPLEKRLWI